MGRNNHTYWDIPGKLLSGATVLALLVLSCCPLFAQEKLLPVIHLNRLQGYGREFVTARVVRDSLGFIWIGTANGLQRYDGYEYKMYRNDPNDSTSIPSNRIHSLLVDSKGGLWVGTQEKGLCLYDAPRDRFVQVYPEAEDTSRRGQEVIFDMIEDHSGNIWLAMGHPDDLVRVEVPEEAGSNNPDSFVRSLHFRSFPVPGTPGDGLLRDVCERKDGKILATSLRGLIILDPATGRVSRPHLAGSIGRRLDTLAVGLGLIQASDGNLWVGTATEGVFRIDWESGKVVNYRHRDGDNLSIGSDEIWDIVEDRRGNLWIGTFNGVEIFSPKTGKRIPYIPYRKPPGGNVRIRLSFDCRGTLWIGTAQFVYQLTTRSQFFQHFTYTDGHAPSPSGEPWLGAFYNIRRTPEGNLWGISEGKLVQLDIAARSIGKKIDLCSMRNYSVQPTGPASSLLDGKGNFWWAAWDLGVYSINLGSGVVNNYSYATPLGKTTTIHSIAQGPGDSLWVGAFEQGVFKFNPGSGRFLTTGIRYGSTVMVDHEGKVWITANNGLYVFDPATGRTIRYVNVPSDPHSLSQSFTSSTYEDASRRIWVGAGNTVNLWDPATRSFTRYPNTAFSDQDGNPVGSDSKGRLWIAYTPFTSGYLSILDPSNGRFTNFAENDGLCDGITDMENLKDGRILLTGYAGVNIVSVDSVNPDRTPPPLVITRMTINDETVVPPPLLKGSGSLHLSHIQDVVEFEFAAMDIDARGPVEYRYQLEGLERDRVKPAGRRYVRYTGVPPGEYVFRVSASSVWGRWPDQVVTVAVIIAPPWWRTMWAYIAYILFILGLLYAGYRVRLHQVRLRQDLELGQFKAEHLAEVDRLKSRFFANISHEFRTPLTLIAGPIDGMLSEEKEEKKRQTLSMMQRNSQRLLRLINQLLDLSRLEAGAMKLHAARTNIVSLVKGIAYSFESSARIRGVALDVDCKEDEREVYCDRDMVEKILSNLLSNAFKFTAEGGKVSVNFTTKQSDQTEKERLLRRITPRSDIVAGEYVELSVHDTGIGIPPDQLDRVFDRFYQVDASQTRMQEGSGIGLALIKELVELHHGTIQVKSQVSRGSTFTVRLPLGRSHLKDDEVVEERVGIEPTLREAEGTLVDKTGGEAPGETEPEQIKAEKPIVLVVEDNADVRAYIRDYLLPAYQVTDARDGAEGIGKAREVVPDLIISDVMMPGKDGYEVCRTLKRDEKTSHIPIILLTAKAASENKTQGLEIGADDYLIKPFEPKELLARVKNLIAIRRKLRERFKTSVPLKPGEVAVMSMDDAFLHKVMAAVEQHIGDEHFHIEELGAQLGMSRVQLHRKLTALTNQGPGEFIRYVRLHRAMELLQKDAGTVSEIAYRVGFSTPSYFSKAFRKQFGKAPIDVRKTSVDADNSVKTT